MRHRRLKKKHTPIDSSMLPFGKPVHIDDPAYLRSFRDCPCMVCGSTETTVGCHVRKEGDGGMGYKPSDNLALPLCGPHHAEEGAGEEKFWRKYFNISIREVQEIARDRYRRWLKCRR